MEWDNYSIIELFHLLKRDRLSFNDKDDQSIEVFRYLLSLSTCHRCKHLTFSPTEPGTGPISTKPCTKHPYVKGIVCSNKGIYPLPRGNNT